MKALLKALLSNTSMFVNNRKKELHDQIEFPVDEYNVYNLKAMLGMRRD